uniref:spectrin beta chain, non-erythrocytic 5-like n=1 Tax=Pristiophorus japonicus TaxID=55135 RepID=UPI00398F68B2
MPGGVSRRVQPFTVGTRLSAPWVPWQALPPGAQRGGDDQAPPSSSLLPRPPLGLSQRPAPATRDAIASSGEEEGEAGVSRAIRKISISTSPEGDRRGPAEGPGQAAATSHSNANNNNSSSRRHAATAGPHIISFNSRSPPHSRLKVHLRSKDPEAAGERRQSPTEKCFPHKDEGRPREEEGPDWSVSRLSGINSLPEAQVSISRQEGGRRRGLEATAGAVPEGHPTLRHVTAQYNRERVQAEAWIRGKLHDLKDGCDTETHLLQDWDQLAQTLQSDLTDFETHMTKLAKSGELLLRQPSPGSDLTGKQLQQLREQWDHLKQTAANQRKALAAAKELNDFHRKADKLEAWISEQEEQSRGDGPSRIDSDKVHLTRRILELKQEEQENSKLFDQINSFATSLEKRGRVSGGSVSGRRKQLQKMWLKVQGLLSQRHQALQVSLEGASFHHQAHRLLKAIAEKQRASDTDPDTDGETHPATHRDLRDIASQMLMLDVSASQLSGLYPTLAQHILPLHREVKGHWALLQQGSKLRRKAPGVWTQGPGLSSGEDPASTSHPVSNSEPGRPEGGPLRNQPLEASEREQHGT